MHNVITDNKQLIKTKCTLKIIIIYEPYTKHYSHGAYVNDHHGHVWNKKTNMHTRVH